MTKKYKIQYNKGFIKDLQKIPRSEQKRIKDKIFNLSEDPRPQGHKKLRARKSLYRIRSGDYRIVYTIEDSVLLILVISVGHRREVNR